MKSMLVATALAVGTCLVAPAIASAAYTVPITATSGSGKTLKSYTGTFTIKHFQNVDSQLVAVGTLSINNAITSLAIPVKLSNSPAPPLGPVTSQAAAVTASCPILNLVLGPLNLNLLGLQVTLNQVILNITALPGAGNLLGNLLCDVAGLLNPGAGGLTGVLDELVAVLNQILSAL
jgi:hypothetical protein